MDYCDKAHPAEFCGTGNHLTVETPPLNLRPFRRGLN